MSLQKSFKITVAVILIMTLFTGCMNNRHLKDIAIVEGMGIDEKDSEISLIIQTLNAGINSGGQPPKGNMTINTTKDGKTISDAISNLSKSLSKRIFFGQNKLIVVGKKLAQNKFEDNLDYILRSSDSRSDVAICMSDDSAKQIIESKENKASVPCENIVYLINNNEKSGLSILVTSNELLNMYADKTTDIFLPVLSKEKKDDSVKTKGIALFSDNKLMHITDDDETVGFVFMNGEITDVIIEVEDEKFGKIGVKLSNIKCKKSAQISNGKIIFGVKITADMIIDEIQKGIITSLDENSHKKIQKLIENEVNRLCKKAFAACRDNDSDALRVGEYLAKDDPDAYAQMSSNWKSYFKNAQIDAISHISVKKISDNTQLE